MLKYFTITGKLSYDILNFVIRPAAAQNESKLHGYNWKWTGEFLWTQYWRKIRITLCKVKMRKERGDGEREKKRIKYERKKENIEGTKYVEIYIN